MPWTLLDSWDNANETSGTTLTVTTDAAIPAGSWIIGTFACDNSGSSLPTITLTTTAKHVGALNDAAIQGTASTSVPASVRGHIFRVYAPAEVPSGTGFTFTLSAAVAAKAAVIAAFTPPTGATVMAEAVDTSASASSAGTRTTTTTPSYNGNQATVGSLVVAVGVEESSWATITPPTGYSEVHRESGTGGLASVTAFIAWDEVEAAGVPAPAHVQSLANAAGVGAAYLLTALSAVTIPARPTIAGARSGQLWPR